MFPRKKELEVFVTARYGVSITLHVCTCMYKYVRAKERVTSGGDVNNARRRLLGGVEGLAAG